MDPEKSNPASSSRVPIQNFGCIIESRVEWDWQCDNIFPKKNLALAGSNPTPNTSVCVVCQLGRSKSQKAYAVQDIYYNYDLCFCLLCVFCIPFTHPHNHQSICSLCPLPYPIFQRILIPSLRFMR